MALNKIINDFVESADYDFSKNGYARMASGLIIQWGEVDNVTTTNGTQLFPLAFPNSHLSVVITDYSNTTSSVVPYAIEDTSTTSTQFKWWNSNSPTGQGGRFNWIAIGY